jgi:membrane complex biogenesis BtpA family protein
MKLELSKSEPPIIGMVHLLPLPGAPGWSGDLSAVEQRAKADVSALVGGGVHGLLFENFGDAPFTKGNVGPLTVSCMTAVVQSCIKDQDIPFGINVLRNDWEAALAIAAVTGAAFIRINILTGVYATDQGVIEGAGYRCLRYKRSLEQELGTDLAIFADAHTKHGRPLVDQPLEDVVKDLGERMKVDGIIITGTRTGAPALEEDLKCAIAAAGSVPILVGSGVDKNNIKKYSKYVHGFIVGSSVKEDGDVSKPVDHVRVKELVECLS